MKSILVALLFVALSYAVVVPTPVQIYDNTQVAMEVPKDGANAVKVHVDYTTCYTNSYTGNFSVRFYVSFDNILPGRILNVYYSFDNTMTYLNFAFNMTSPHVQVSFPVYINYADCLAGGNDIYVWIMGTCPLSSCINSISIHAGAEYDHNLIAIYAPMTSPYPVLVPGFHTLSYMFTPSYWGYFTFTTILTYVSPMHYDTTLGFLSSVKLLGKNSILPTLNSNDWYQSTATANQTFTLGTTDVAFYADTTVSNNGWYSLCMCSAASASTVSILLTIAAILALLF